MHLWQWIVCLVFAAAAIGVMSSAIIRLFTRQASLKATLRRASPAESGLFTTTVPEEAQVLDA